MTLSRRISFVCAFAISAAFVSQAEAQRVLLADGSSWPGKIIEVRDQTARTLWERAVALPNQQIPRVRSITIMPNGRLVFCSGLDRSVMTLGSGGEQELHHGGSLVRQVRTDTNGDLYWSGVETPIDNNPLPDGFINRVSAVGGQAETLVTFSQGDVGRDWWGAFDVRDGRIYVATHQQPARIYELVNSIPQLQYTLPIGISAFRIDATGAVLATDGQGKLYRYARPQDTAQFEVLVDQPNPFVDFAIGN